MSWGIVYIYDKPYWRNVSWELGKSKRGTVIQSVVIGTRLQTHQVNKMARMYITIELYQVLQRELFFSRGGTSSV